ARLGHRLPISPAVAPPAPCPARSRRRQPISPAPSRRQHPDPTAAIPLTRLRGLPFPPAHVAPSDAEVLLPARRRHAWTAGWGEEAAANLASIVQLIS
ncbi:hypothetical protein U9M48_015443, partial [Paspalum notatum var. saurae]